MKYDYELWKLSSDDAEKIVQKYDSMDDSGFEAHKNRWKARQIDEEGLEPSSLELRKKVLQVYSQYYDDPTKALGRNEMYRLDYKLGLFLYSELSFKNGFTTVVANDDDLWRYLSCKVFPDITYERYSEPKAGDIRINRKRFYSHTRRIWLKTLWWFVHLSWQGSNEATENVLKACNIDTINKLFEQPGDGFRLDLCRELMKQYYFVENKSSKQFERIQKQNLVNCRNVEPALVCGGERGYLQSLFRQLSINVGE